MTDPTIATPTFFGDDVLLDRLARAPREVVFFFGAPLSIPENDAAPGVPGVAGVIALIETELADSPSALEPARALLKAGDVGAAYRAAFERLQAFRGQDFANRVIRRAVLQARRPSEHTDARVEQALGLANYTEACQLLEADPANWHLRASLRALGLVLAGHRNRFGGTVLTTNFDPLIELAVHHSGGRYLRTVLQEDGSLHTTEGAGVKVVHLHGDWIRSDTLHTPVQLTRARPQLRRSLARLLGNRTLVVFGCGGWDDIFMSALEELVSDSGAAPDVLWTFYEGDPEQIRARYSHVLRRLADGIARSRVILYGGVDLHAVLPRLLDVLQTLGPADQPEEVRALMERLLELAPDLRRLVTEKINPSLLAQVNDFQKRHDQLEAKLEEARAASAELARSIETERKQLDSQLREARRALTTAQVTLANAALRDGRWLEMRRTTLMPPEKHRVPFHNSAEVALRGFHTSNMLYAEPRLDSVTWSQLPHHDKYHRGYRAAVIFRGDGFAPGITLVDRRIGEAAPTMEQQDHWQQPSIYFGDYLELAAHDDEVEAPLGFRSREFAVRNPNGKQSAWVPFSHPFDDTDLDRRFRTLQAEGAALVRQAKYADAREPLRRAWAIARALPQAVDDVAPINALLAHARDMAVRVTLRFIQGDRIRIVSGARKNAQAQVEKIQTNQTRPYWVRLGSGELEAFADDELEKLADIAADPTDQVEGS